MLQRVRSTYTARYGSTADHSPAHLRHDTAYAQRIPAYGDTRLTMLPRTSQALFIALTAALLIILGTFGIFAAEASSFQVIVSEVNTYGSVLPIDPNVPDLAEPETATIPSLPY
jgi:hypothetical protein